LNILAKTEQIPRVRFSQLSVWRTVRMGVSTASEFLHVLERSSRMSN
jgi:hypothetical protein